MHKIHFRPGLRPRPARTLLGELNYTTLPRTPSRMLMEHLSLRFLPLVSTPSASRSQDIQNGGGGVIGPRDSVFPGPAVALDGPASVSAFSRFFAKRTEPKLQQLFQHKLVTKYSELATTS